ncbi:type II secretion system secretin GspD [Acidovorax sp. NCPPB 4044]|uniref:type II secretion system secretin GspD n=1 Tax=Acidovorax sp. NCPPB 4044 TaxID=2940490 RepID=UPI00230228D9|nr:type II secretion system secretin GspD [Acidovorax sp. NCPPB 4044]MDA8522497.1 type II secretion system secretin GspD [Acidovorax sp. NCPPB 4044]
MISYRYALTSISLAVCQMAAAQAPSLEAVTGTNITTESAATGNRAAVASEAGNAMDAKTGSAVGVGQGEEERTVQPRMMRGNDRVLAEPKSVPPITGAPMSFSFEEAPVAEVVRTILGDIGKANYVLHPPLNGTVTLSTRAPIPPDQAMFLLESALQANGLGMLRDARGTYHVGRPDALRAIGGTLRQVRSGEPLPPGNGAIIVPLQYIGAAEMASILRPMVAPDAIVRVDNLRNLLVLSGTRTQAESWLDLVNTFDVDLLKGMSVGVFPLKYASIKEVEAALRVVSGGGAGPAPSSGAAAGSASAAAAVANQASAAPVLLGEGNPLFGALRIMPIERINSLLVVTPRASYLDEARRWIEKLDQPSDNGAEPQLFIYHVQNGNAKHLAGVLAGIFGGQSGGSTANSGVAPGLGGTYSNSFGQGSFGSGSSGFGNSAFGNSTFNSSGFGSSGGLGNRSGLSGNSFGSMQTNRTGQSQGNTTPGVVGANIGGIRVMADELNNSVLIWGTKSEYSKIEATLKRLDLPPTQVLIEASIVEVTLDDTLQYGLQWAFNNSGPSGYSGTGQLLSNSNNSGVIGTIPTAAASGFTYSLSNSLGRVRVVLNALATKRLLKVISSPSLMVLDNHTAMMSVGNQQPVQTASTTFADNSNSVTSTIQYRDTGVSLAVTPSVNAGNLVTMQIDQSVTDAVADSSGSVSLQPVFQQRQITSKVAVRSGEAIVLGGLIRDTSNASKSGVPLLQELPLVGSLFSNNGKTGNRTELLVVITPKVVRTDIDIREVSDELRDRLKGLQVIELRETGRGNSPAQSAPVTVQPLQPQ